MSESGAATAARLGNGFADGTDRDISVLAAPA